MILFKFKRDLKRLVLVFSFWFCCDVYGAKAQTPDSSVVQLSGIVLDADSLSPVSFITLRIRGTDKGLIANAQGFFSLPIHRNDTVQFSAVGYATYLYRLSEPVAQNKVYITIKLRPSVYLLKGVFVRGMTREQFKRELFSLKLPPEPMVNPNAVPRGDDIKLPPPPGIRFSPSELISEIPFIDRAIKRRRSKRFIKDETDIPTMK